MALFGKKKSDAAPETDAEQQEAAPKFSPEKARRFFEHAKTVHEATNYEYAMTSWLNGMRLDPSEMNALEGFWKSATVFIQEGGTKLSRETKRSFADRKDPVQKYLGALLDWSVEQLNPALAVKAAEAASSLHGVDGADMAEPTYWIAERALPLIGRDKKPRKDLCVKLMEAAAAVGAYDLAVRSGDMGVRIDPSDVALATRVKNMAAQATMSSGGYDKTGEEGGFLANIRNAGKQQQLSDEDRLVKTDDIKDRLVLTGEAEYKERPGDLPTISKLVKALVDRGRPEDEVRAYKLLMKAYEDSDQFRFRQQAGDIRLRQAKRKLSDYLAAAEQNPDDEQAVANAKKARQKFLEMELQEYRLRVEAYPTDVAIKFHLGRLEFELGNYDEAIALLQVSKNDPKNRVQSLSLLARSFLAKQWLDEAIQTFRDGLQQLTDQRSGLGMELRYGLMEALATKASEEKDLQAASEAEKLASAIAIEQIGFRDIQAKREQIKKLVAELK